MWPARDTAAIFDGRILFKTCYDASGSISQELVYNIHSLRDLPISHNRSETNLEVIHPVFITTDTYNTHCLYYLFNGSQIGHVFELLAPVPLEGNVLTKSQEMMSIKMSSLSNLDNKLRIQIRMCLSIRKQEQGTHSVGLHLSTHAQLTKRWILLLNIQVVHCLHLQQRCFND